MLIKAISKSYYKVLQWEEKKTMTSKDLVFVHRQFNIQLLLIFKLSNFDMILKNLFSWIFSKVYLSEQTKSHVSTVAH